MMILVGLLVLATSGIVIAQQGTTCDCYAYFVCDNRTWNKDVECQYHNEVCCLLDPIVTPAPDPVPPNPRTPTPNPYSDSEECGLRKQAKTGVFWKIDFPEGVDGSTTRGEYPWMVAILRNTPSGPVFLCGGSIIYPNLVLTAAHSVNGIPASELTVKAGVWNTTDISEVLKHQNRKVQQSLVHSDFDKEAVANDFAILVLDQPLIKTDEVSPVCLPSLMKTVNESTCVATGWGADKYGNQNGNILKQVSIPLVDFDICQNKLKQSSLGQSFKLHNSFLCAGGGAAGDTCVGDGGGPLMCATVENPNQYVQIGITSWGTGCGKGDPGVYSSVEFVSNWIKEQANLFPPITVKLQP